MAVAAVVAAGLWTQRADPRPSFVLVITDDQHPAAINVMSTTLTEVAGRGVEFTNAFTTTPICAPSRANILKGQYPTTHGVTSNGKRQPDGSMGNAIAAFDDSSTLATWLDDAGYTTALMGKYINHYDKLSPYIPPGWDEWYAFVDDSDTFFDYTLNENGRHVRYRHAAEDYATDVLARHAVNFIRHHAGTPFLLVLAFPAPHSPSYPAPRHKGRLANLPLEPAQE